jgi:hypothetical protein
VYAGASKPLIVPARHDPQIHGEDGLEGAEGLPDADSAEVTALMATDSDGKPVRALEGMAQSIRTTWNNGAGHQVTVISTGPMTNIGAIMWRSGLMTCLQIFPSVQRYSSAYTQTFSTVLKHSYLWEEQSVLATDLQSQVCVYFLNVEFDC